MESNYYPPKRTDKQLIVLTHLAQLLIYCTGVGGLIVPLIIWITQKERVEHMDFHGKAIINFQLSAIVYAIISVPLILVFGLGFLLLFLNVILTLVFPIVNAIKASNGETPYYPLSIKFLN